ncbi:ATP-binding protein [Rhodococcoides kyotonense]|uniref:Anti-sigma regulatory factor (Ser/Thr protein kinase) n=1 Tax=Rhodococcoides kyotonense TaxID=398843 RepID=A0A239ERU2_9NOCA|nr:ATP-binding protein [Rhodococcus kyotonensis]SNS47289.1 Anti-sigma regulatory factor (Ser/Thr protein kinase) [Rhodococcus kyotonensis]
MTGNTADDAGAHRWTYSGPAVPEAATTLRRRIRHWASDLSVPETVVDSIELATYEALANVVEHAYTHTQDRGEMTLTAIHEQDTLTVTIADTGTWQPPTPTPDRSRGLALIDAVSDRVELESTEAGTVVTMAWTLSAVPAP